VKPPPGSPILCPARALHVPAVGLPWRVGFGLFVLILPMLGCEAKSVIGTWSCPPIPKTTQSSTSGGAASTDGNTSTAGGTSASNGGNGGGGASNGGSSASSGGSSAATTHPPQKFEFPWSYGFEDGECGYTPERGGFCYKGGSSNLRFVSEPVHSGLYAAEFAITAATKVEAAQVRCVREGTLPTAAYYGAWYYISAIPDSNASWNLFHFQGDNASKGGNTWDVTLVHNSSGDLSLFVYNSWVKLPDQLNNPALPIGEWFHIVMYLRLATDDTGEVTLYQNDTSIFHLANIKTDNSSGWGQWYVGNYAFENEQGELLLYVDDLTISATR